MSEKEILEKELAELHKKKEELETDKRNIEELVNTVTIMLGSRQKAIKAIEEINNKPEPTITISAKVDTVDLHCKKCGAHLINLIPRQYSPYRNDGKSNNKDMPVIKYDIVSENSVCDQCGCNLFDADIKIAIDKPLRNKG